MVLPADRRPGRRLPGRLAWILLALGLASCREAPRQPSVLLVTLDTTRADRLGCYGREGADTPWLDSLAARGTLFESAYTSAPITLPAHASIFTGTYPQFHGVRDNGSFRLDSRLVTMAEVFAAAGFRTGAFVGAYPLDSQFGLDQGFEVYDDRLSAAGPERFGYSERPAGDVVAATLTWLDDLGAAERFFGWVHVFDPHAPYASPEPFGSRHRDDPYQGEVAYVDHALGALFEQLEGRGRGDDTLIVVVADHGEGLGDHGEDSHAALIYDTTMRVPLLIAGPGIPPGVRVGETVRTIDILSTLTALLGLEAPPDDQGDSMVPLLTGTSEAPREAYLETEWPHLQYGWSPLRGLVQDGWKLVEAPASDSSPELYRIAEDPHETDDRAAEREPLERLRRRLAAVLAETTAQAPFDATRNMSPEDEGRLAALGYLGTPRSESRPGAHPRERLRVMRGIVAVRRLVTERRLHDALALLARLEEEDPDGLGLHEHRGLVYRELGAQDPTALVKAAAEFRRALEIDPRRAESWVQLGEIQRAQGRHEDALESYTRSLALAPPSPDLVINIAGLLAAAGRSEEAIARLEASIDEQPDHLASWLTLAVTQAGAGRQAEALAHFQKVIAESAAGDPLRVRGHELAGLLLEQMNRKDDAIRHYQAALTLDPRLAETRARLERLRADTPHR